MEPTPAPYAPVEQEQEGLTRLTDRLRTTWPAAGALGAVELPFGQFANIVRINETQGMAITTDGVGTKVLIAQLLGRYDTIGIDCVAMNVNDLVCVGATPMTLVDYIALQRLEPRLLDEIGVGLAAGAKISGVSITGGEIAQIPDVVHGVPGANGFDIAATAIGMVPLDRILVGQSIQPGDALIGIESNGIHSNGLTLARAALLRESGGVSVESHIDGLRGTVGEELLAPTHIYVPEALEIIARIPSVKAMVHITGDGLLNLLRVMSQTGYEVDNLPAAPPVFDAIERLSSVPKAEMFRVFNMGIGFCVVVAPEDANEVVSIVERVGGKRAWIIGRTVHDPRKRIWLRQFGLVGEGKLFQEGA